MKRIYLGLGSNLGDREEALQNALRALHRDDLRILRVSPVYETAPRDVPDQPWFLNLVAEVDTTLFPVRLLARVGSIERTMGRRRIQAKGPRLIDIDILLFGRAVVSMPALEIPHPRMLERRFVLQPLTDLVPDLRHPGTLKTLKEHLGAVLDQPLRPHPFQPEW